MYRNTRFYSVISYFTWIGFAAAFLLHDRGDHLVQHHLNQALVLNLIETIGGFLSRRRGFTGLAGEVIDVVCLVLLLMGIVRAVKMSDEPLPLIGDIHLLW